MTRTIIGTFCFVALLAIAANAQQPVPSTPVPKPLTNPDVVKLEKLGLGDDVVVAKIRQAPGVAFKVETDDLAALKSAGVSGKVIAAMIDRVSGASVGGVPTPQSVRALIPTGRGGATSETTLDTREGSVALVSHAGGFHTTGFMGIGNAFFVFEGAKAALRTSDGRPSIVIRRDTSPQQQIFLVKFEVDDGDNDRSLKIGSMLKGGNPFSDKKAANPDPDWTVPYDATEGPAGIWRLTPKTELAPGQYGLYYATGMVLDFGVEAGSEDHTH